MENQNVINAFSKLDLDDKKNKISDELLFIGELIKKIEYFYNIESNFEIKNYDINSKLDENEMLDFLYEDIFKIEKQLLTIITNLENN